MPDLTPRERLQPCLLDRLTDERTDLPQESRDQRVVSLARYREGVLRDIRWLLNARAQPAESEVNEFAHAAGSVLNFGIEEPSGKTVTGRAVEELEQRILKAIQRYEPRILPGSVSVQAKSGLDDREAGVAIVFEIMGDLWAQPACAVLHIKTSLDLETGRADAVAGQA